MAQPHPVTTDTPTPSLGLAETSLLIVDDDRPFSSRLARAMEGRG